MLSSDPSGTAAPAGSPDRLPLRVLHVLGELRSSGAEMMLASGADEYRRQGIETLLVAAGRRPGSFAQGLVESGHTVVHLTDRPLGALPLRLARVLRRARPDVVHVHTERANFWLALVARSMGTRVVRSVHAGFEFRGRLRVERRLQRRVLAALGVASVSVSREVAANEQHRFANPSTLVENWIDGTRFRLRSEADRQAARRKLGVPAEAQVVATVGNCSPVKRHGLVLAALPLLAARTPSIVYLHLGEEDPTDDERQVVQRENLGSVVRFLGPGDPLPVLQAADVFVMPSSREGLGLACAEALAVGVSSVVTDVPGLRGFAEYDGLVRVVTATPEGIAGAVDDLLASRPADAAAAAVSAAVRDRFDVRRGVTDLVACYERRGQRAGGRALRRTGGDRVGA